MSTHLKTQPRTHSDSCDDTLLPPCLLEGEAPLVSTPGIYNSAQQSLTLGQQVGGGGEGAVYEIQGQSEFVAKLYHEPPSPEKAAKLAAMVQFDAERLSRIAAWPVDVLRDRPGGNVIGFVMHKISEAEEVHALHSPKSRLRKFPDASWSFLIHVATNIARAVATLHEQGFVIGDVNPKNILVTKKATIYLLDCDSFQFTRDGQSYRCAGGFPEYTPPELQGLALGDLQRTQEHDCFGLAVVIFQLLFLGRHPYSGRFLGAGEMTLEQAIREGRFAYGAEAAARQMQPPPGTLPLEAIPAEVTELLQRAFLTTARPSASDWLAPLTALATNLQRCALHNGHYYHEALAACPWCEIESRARIRLFNFNPGEARRHQSAFRLEEMWAEVEKLRHFETLEQKVLPLPTLSPEVLQHVNERRTRFWVALLAAVFGGVLSAVIGGVCAAFWLVPMAWFMVKTIAGAKEVRDPRDSMQSLFGMPPPAAYGELAQKVYQRQKTTENDVRELEEKMGGAKEREAYYTKLDDLQTKLLTHEHLARQRQHKLAGLEAKARTKALREYLQQFDVKDAGLNEIATTELYGRGMRTAADLTEQRCQQFRAVSTAFLTEQLQAWRRGLESQFTFDPAQAVPAAARQPIEAEGERRQHQLEYEITSTTQYLRQLKQQMDTRRQQLLPSLQQARQSYAQTEKDLEVLRQRNRMWPLTLVLLLSFFLSALLNNPFGVFGDIVDRPYQPTLAEQEADAQREAMQRFQRYHEEGQRYLAQERFAEAKQMFLAAAELVSEKNWDHQYARLYYDLADTQMKLNQARQAIAELEEISNAHPADNRTRFRLILFYHLTGQKREAAAHTLLLNTTNEAMALSLKQVLKEHGKESPALIR